MKPQFAHRLLRCCLLLALTSPLPSAPAAAAELATNTVHKDGEVVTITVPIDVHVPANARFRVPGVGLTDAQGLASYWESGAEGIWNSGLAPFVYRGCYQLKVDIQIGVVTGDRFGGDPDHHQVHLRDSGYRSRVYRGGGRVATEDDNNTFTHPGLGYWGLIPPATVAHEVGHLLGLSDDYVDVKNSSGATVGVRSLPGRERTMMDDYRSGSPATWFDQNLVDRLGDMLSTYVDMPPCFQGTISIVQQDDRGGGHTRTATLDIAVAVTPYFDSPPDGTASGTFTLDGRVEQGGCEFTYSTAADVSLELALEGPANGPYTLTALTAQPVAESQTHRLCDTRIELTIDWQIGLDIDAIRFEDGRYEFNDGTTNVLLHYFEP